MIHIKIGHSSEVIILCIQTPHRQCAVVSGGSTINYINPSCGPVTIHYNSIHTGAWGLPSL